MRRLPLLAAALGGAVLMGTGCGSNVCDRSDTLVTSTLAGDCHVAMDPQVLGAKSSCGNALPSCSSSDTKALEDVMSCWETLPVCASATQSAWVDQANGCYAKANGISQACRDALQKGGELEVDGGSDGGTATMDAGPQPDMTGTGALDIISASNATQVAFAWTSSQSGNVDHWAVYPFTAADLKEDPIFLPNAKDMYFTQDIGMGAKKKYFVVGLNADDSVVQGFIGGETSDEDAGMDLDGGMTCTDNSGCSPDMVCNVGQCQTLSCEANPGICPTGYTCVSSSPQSYCSRSASMGGSDGGSKPFISELAEISTLNPSFSADHPVINLQVNDIDLVAIDTARQFMIMQQEASVLGFYSEDRGKTWSTVPIDNVPGAHAKLAYEPTSHTLFACYNANGGVRVRRSADYGKTWKTSAVDLVNMVPDDGGVADLISQCDIAPWRTGQAAITALDGDSVKLWTINSDGSVAGEPQLVFASTPTQFSPQDPTIATLPDDFMMHILFTVTRKPSASVTDKEVLGMYRDMNSGGLIGPMIVDSEKTLGTSYDQYSPTVVIDPVTKQGVAAWVSHEPPCGGCALSETVYVGYWTSSTKKWATGSDLNVFVQDTNLHNYLVMTTRPLAEDWEARAPSLAVNKDGTVTLAFLAGSNTPSVGMTYNPWSVNFRFDAENKVLGNGRKTWFIPPAAKVSDTRVVNETGNTPGPIVVADPQISMYYGFVEGVGLSFDVPNRPIMVTNPK